MIPSEAKAAVIAAATKAHDVRIAKAGDKVYLYFVNDEDPANESVTEAAEYNKEELSLMAIAIIGLLADL